MMGRRMNSGIKINRIWAMPNRWTFTIKPIKELINAYFRKEIPILKKDRQIGGKSGVKNRPDRPNYKVIYVPSIVNTNKNEVNSEAEGSSKSPHFRRGHFKMLRSDKYTNKQGELVFTQPCFIHAGKQPTTKNLYVAV
jgi:hypothetical protein